MEADLLDVFDTLSTLVATLGYPLFDPVIRPSATNELFYLKGRDAEATGELVAKPRRARRPKRGRSSSPRWR